MKEFVYNERKPQQLQKEEITERNVLKSLLEPTAGLSSVEIVNDPFQNVRSVSTPGVDKDPAPITSRKMF
ncbi:hypothetical protein TNCT_1571 [Trichonephila clavata]|uniref:Uncharacterized protein n=1 Tax=Trichonephila clavata TaxID=2740835 RepID=A0A8X6HAA4_TRICU|nr:hypothetical protein TNCT_1571 [Trichonephila clavata]